MRGVKINCESKGDSLLLEFEYDTVEEVADLSEPLLSLHGLKLGRHIARYSCSVVRPTQQNVKALDIIDLHGCIARELVNH